MGIVPCPCDVVTDYQVKCTKALFDDISTIFVLFTDGLPNWLASYQVKVSQLNICL